MTTADSTDICLFCSVFLQIAKLHYMTMWK